MYDENRARSATAAAAKADAEHEKLMASIAKKRMDTAREAETAARTNQPFDEKKYFPQLSNRAPVCTVKPPITLTTVINKKHCLVDKAWKPASLVDVAGVQFDKDAAASLTQMMAAADKAGVNFEVTSGFRTFDEQAALYAEENETGASGQPVDAISARPGHSEHHTGRATDFKIGDCSLDCFGTTRRYAWLKENAHMYGFIERYPASLGEITGYIHEPWHWRYVGKDTASAMKREKIETMEMFFGISGGDYYGS